MTKYVKSPINYIGNKYKLISQIEPLFPRDINTFADVFGGSGTVLINTKAEHYIYNEKSIPLVNIRCFWRVDVTAGKGYYCTG